MHAKWLKICKGKVDKIKETNCNLTIYEDELEQKTEENYQHIFEGYRYKTLPCFMLAIITTH